MRGSGKAHGHLLTFHRVCVLQLSGSGSKAAVEQGERDAADGAAGGCEVRSETLLYCS